MADYYTRGQELAKADIADETPETRSALRDHAWEADAEIRRLRMQRDEAREVAHDIRLKLEFHGFYPSTPSIDAMEKWEDEGEALDLGSP